MKERMGVQLGKIIRGSDNVVLCFDWFQGGDENGCRIKVRCGSRKFLQTLFRTETSESVEIVHWRNSGGEYLYEIKNPEVLKKNGLLRLDLTKELSAMNVELCEGEEFEQGFNYIKGSDRCPYIESEWIYVGEYGFYYSSWSWNDIGRNDLHFCFAPPGAQILNRRVREIKIDTFDSISDENMEPFYEYMDCLMDYASASGKYTEETVTALFLKNLPPALHMDILCEDRCLTMSVNHLGDPRAWFCRCDVDVENGRKKADTGKMAMDNPMERMVAELIGV